MPQIIKLSDNELKSALNYIKEVQQQDEQQIIQDMNTQIKQQRYEEAKHLRVREYYNY